MLWRLNKRSLNLFSPALTSDKDRQMRCRILILTGLLVLSIAAKAYALT